jgi:hypothetical protein
MSFLFALLLITEAHRTSSTLLRHSSQHVSVPTNESLKDAFNETAESNQWGSGESVSGPGSELAVTAPIRECLGHWIQKYNIHVLVDCPCGDANWQGYTPGIETIQYHGYDIADLPLERARKKHAGKAMTFEHLDLTSTVPPVRGDLIMVRDVIQHLPLDKGRKMLENAKASGAKYIAVTSFTDGVNTGTTATGFYKNNVHQHPFNMPPPLESCQNYAQSGVAVKWFPTDFLELIDLAAWHS